MHTKNTLVEQANYIEEKDVEKNDIRRSCEPYEWIKMQKNNTAKRKSANSKWDNVYAIQ